MTSMKDPNFTRFWVSTKFSIDYLKSFVNEYKIEAECDAMKPWMEHLKLLSGLDQSIFQFEDGKQRFHARGSIASNGNQLQIL